MRTIIKTKLLILAISVLSILFLIQCSEIIEPEKSNTNPIKENSIYSDGSYEVVLAGNENCRMTEEEKADLLYMREEEKLARDIYNFLYNEWGMTIFAKISPSEQNHMDALKRLIDKHKMTDIDPVFIQPAPGLFVNEKIQNLYDQLEVKGVLSQTDALEVGVLVEEIDIEDLEHFLTRVDNKDIINVYENILDGSYFHLSSFESLLPLQNTDE